MANEIHGQMICSESCVVKFLSFHLEVDAMLLMCRFYTYRFFPFLGTHFPLVINEG